MNTDYQRKLKKRVVKTAGEAWKDHGYVSAIDVLTAIGWLDPKHVLDWRKGRIPYLEKVVHASLGKISRAMRIFREWAKVGNLKPSETGYVQWKRGPKRHLRFSRSSNPHIEKAYRTHFVSKKMSEAKQRRLQEKLSQPIDIMEWESRV